MWFIVLAKNLYFQSSKIYFLFIHNAFTQKTYVLMSSSSSEDVFKISSRRLHQDEYVRLRLKTTENVSKTSCSRPIYSFWLYVFKTSLRRLQDVLPRQPQHVFKTSSRSLAKTSSETFKTSSGRQFMVSVQSLKERSKLQNF